MNSRVRSPETAATAAVLSLLLELSANPKSGNVDRGHDLPGLRYEHFLASSASSYPVFLRAAKKESTVGDLILQAVIETSKWHRARNVHFGSFLLLIPLVYSWDAGNTEAITANAINAMKTTTVDDSLAVLKAFRLSEARVMKASSLSLEEDRTENELIKRNLNLYEWMLLAPEENIIARELTEGYRLSIEGMRGIFKAFKEFGDINTAIVLVYHHFLSRFLDPLVIAKHGRKIAEEVRKKAEGVVKLFSGDLEVFTALDCELVNRRINPGTIADLTVSSIFLSLIGGMRF